MTKANNDEFNTVKIDMKKQLWNKGQDMIFKQEMDKIKKDEIGRAHV